MSAMTTQNARPDGICRSCAAPALFAFRIDGTENSMVDTGELTGSSEQAIGEHGAGKRSLEPPIEHDRGTHFGEPTHD